MEQIWSGFAAAAAMNGTNLLRVANPFLLQYTLKATAVPTLHSQGRKRRWNDSEGMGSRQAHKLPDSRFTPGCNRPCIARCKPLG